MTKSILIISRVSIIPPSRVTVLSLQQSRRVSVLYSPFISNTTAAASYLNHQYHRVHCLISPPLQYTVATVRRNCHTSSAAGWQSSLFQFQPINGTETSCRRSFASSEFQAKNDQSKNRTPTKKKSKQNNEQSKYPSSSGQPPRPIRQNDILPVSHLLDNYMKNHMNLKPYQVSITWNDLGKAVQKLRKWERQNFWIDHKCSLETLVDQTIESAVDFDGRATATVTHSLVKLLHLSNSSFRDEFQSLWDTLLLRTIQHIQSDDFNPHDISNLIWAYAKVDGINVDGRVLNAIAHKAQLCVDDFKPQELSNTSWAFATLNHAAPSLFDAIASKAELRAHNFAPQGLSNVAWAFATMKHHVPSLFDAIASTAPLCIHDFKPQALSNIIMAYAKMNHQSPELFDAIAKHAQKCLVDFIPQNLANTAWSFATLGHQAPSLFDDIAQATQIQIDEFKPQELANTAWSFATLNHQAPSLFDDIARAALLCIHDFKPQELSNIIMAYAKMNHQSPELFDAIAKHTQKCLVDFKPQNLSNTAIAFATLNHKAPSLFEAIARATQTRINEFTQQALANTAWSFVVFNIEPNAFIHIDSTFAQFLRSIDPSIFTVEELSQLHQLHMWCKEQNKSSWFPDELSQRCREAFVSREAEPSQLQNDVVESLRLLQDVNHVEVEVLTEIGYSLDVVIIYRGNWVGVEVDGPFHFVGQSQSPNGKTLLKRRQLQVLEEGIKLVSIPYWEWNEIDTGSNKERKAKKERYLENLLEQATR